MVKHELHTLYKLSKYHPQNHMTMEEKALITYRVNIHFNLLNVRESEVKYTSTSESLCWSEDHMYDTLIKVNNAGNLVTP